MVKKVNRLMMFTFVLGLAAWGCQQSKAKTVDIRVSTAVCEICAERIKTAVSEVPGAKEVSVDLESKTAHVSYDASRTNVAALEDAIVAVGYAANDKPADSTAFVNLPDCCKHE